MKAQIEIQSKLVHLSSSQMDLSCLPLWEHHSHYHTMHAVYELEVQETIRICLQYIHGYLFIVLAVLLDAVHVFYTPQQFI